MDFITELVKEKGITKIINDYKNQLEIKEKMISLMFELKYNNQYRKKNIEYSFLIEDGEEVLTVNYRNRDLELYFIRYTFLETLDGGSYLETNEELEPFIEYTIWD